MGLVFMFLYFLIVAFVIEISVMLFNLTGLETDVSRYQVVSMLTNTGFTTDEAQLILDHPVRRRLSMFLILFGAFSLAVIISSITNILADDLRLKELALINVVLLILVLAGKTPFIRHKLQKKLSYEMEKKLEISELPVKDALYLNEDDLVTDVVIDESSEFIGKKTTELIRRDEDVNILFIKRGKVYVRSSLASEKIQEGDQLFIYGNKKTIKKRLLQDKGQNKSSSN
ncbi:TrkA C-terminal domain-containing protein [Bacillus sp. B190/17]|uniref:TrkA C-terminal domain-containing protein n=1 Tax=Bacillus lumedeiriae TaxID=3058829 RepID=A0ABW8IB61_9BACI